MKDRISNRRTVLKRIGQATTVGAAMSIAGCTGGGGGDGGDGGDGGGGETTTQATTSEETTTEQMTTAELTPVKWTHGTGFSEKANNKDGIDPSHLWELSRRLDQKSDGKIQMNVVGGNQLCSFATCGEKLQARVIQTGSAAFSPADGTWPSLYIWTIPYLFPPMSQPPYANKPAINATVFSKEMWEKFWVPFGKKNGLVPFLPEEAELRGLFIGKGASKELGRRVRKPADIEGMKIRRTFSRMSAKAIESWGANSVEISWADTLQGMKSGLVDGMEIWASANAAFGMADVTGQAVINNWDIGLEPNWITVDFLKQLSAADAQLIGETTKELSEEWVRMTDDINENRVGLADPPKEGSKFAETGTQVNILTEEEMNVWKGDLDPMDNPDQYQKAYDQAKPIVDDPRGFVEDIYNAARSSDIPDSYADFTYEAWWHDYIDELTS